MTLSWSVANRVASIAAAQAHGELDVDVEGGPIDVASAIASAGIELMYRPLPALFGAYLADTRVQGILVNNRMTRAVRRHTAAHELGHHRLGHGTIYDRGATDDATGELAVAPGAPGTERTAEAFATWFLMPLRAVRAALVACDFTVPLSATQVYHLSLRLGTPYAATARQLASLRMADRQQSRAWASVAPGRIKQELADGLLESTRGIDVWDFTGLSGGHTIVASPGDLLVLDAHDAPPQVQGCQTRPTPSPTGRWIVRCHPESADAPITVDTAAGRITVAVPAVPHGRYLPE
ncbi:ImmA/IrrE family metallo-endopeptidase [Mycobacterium riyadhense]|uniref:ImmA/IrrE family metallo-endopeptidase n=1 Tax=Mycobacterium riyadhense TaxID=486698 RepID=UPI00195C8A9A|nr:ImmA/IrrE family metallo-endopeptidase [Mycobacterium riyadhense]